MVCPTANPEASTNSWAALHSTRPQIVQPGHEFMVGGTPGALLNKKATFCISRIVRTTHFAVGARVRARRLRWRSDTHARSDNGCVYSRCGFAAALRPPNSVPQVSLLTMFAEAIEKIGRLGMGLFLGHAAGLCVTGGWLREAERGREGERRQPCTS